MKIATHFKTLVSERVKVHEMRVFGLRARGNAYEFSDLDILIVVDFLDHSTETFISDCAWEAGFPDDIIVVPVVVTLNTLKNTPIRESSFIKNVYIDSIAI